VSDESLRPGARLPVEVLRILEADSEYSSDSSESASSSLSSLSSAADSSDSSSDDGVVTFLSAFLLLTTLDAASRATCLLLAVGVEYSHGPP
jgi:hypothetical protein